MRTRVGVEVIDKQEVDLLEGRPEPERDLRRQLIETSAFGPYVSACPILAPVMQ
jgi:hypothetical protein